MLSRARSRHLLIAFSSTDTSSISTDGTETVEEDDDEGSTTMNASVGVDTRVATFASRTRTATAYSDDAVSVLAVYAAYGDVMEAVMRLMEHVLDVMIDVDAMFCMLPLLLMMLSMYSSNDAAEGADMLITQPNSYSSAVVDAAAVVLVTSGSYDDDASSSSTSSTLTRCIVPVRKDAVNDDCATLTVTVADAAESVGRDDENDDGV